MKALLSILTLLLLLSGCGGSEPTAKKDPNAKPEWIYNPSSQGKIGAVGTSGRTYDQSPSSQRKLAIQRALDELSLQQGVKVTLRMQKHESVTNDHASLSVDQKSSYSAKSTVSAHIQDIWMDRQNEILYVWMVLN